MSDRNTIPWYAPFVVLAVLIAFTWAACVA